uniref:Myb/SANT-like DNA-binding domain-containing protein n=1 Tax=Glycine max TaxID=3847 RepID=C6TI90_SOYBN|nr:unknown [Glycine max]
MEPNALGGGIFPNISSGLLGVENPLQQQPNLQNQQNPHPLHHLQMVSYTTNHDTDTHHQQPPPQQSIKHGYNFSATKSNKSQITLSDEDEPVFTAEDNSSGDPKRKVSPWHRMKWTDTMVKFLIMAVYYIGDEAGSEGTDPTKKKASGLLQKKGKWKSVSGGMMEKGYYVSPQQCEDKFNDLNKRYKRVNDILGKGTACRVVENQTLLDTMDLSPKMKEEVRKLLNSKHLFFREMCAYHNSCGHNNNNNCGSTSNVQQSTDQPLHQHNHQQQQCLHSSENGVGSLRMLKEDEDEDIEDYDSDEFSDEDEDESGEGGSRGMEEDENDHVMRKRARNKGGFGVSSISSQMMQQLNGEVSGVLQDGGKSAWEKKQWMKKKVVQLEEQQVSYQMQAFEMEKQRLKWARFSSKKEREMEKDKLQNERKRLEIERMVLLLRHKELELVNVQQQHQQQHSST